ncbi:hypothetical protein MVEN_01853400 [Mycena venus]|uniref:F-box domain-containing protein n=1 Tax=Mycena venus TaxID=2733690 RepID=A0A8H7CKL4_9AGAR|nr:hypothetical protein MVEN_01853400 [Mycena venus]
MYTRHLINTMLTTTSAFEDLGDDVLLVILCFSDVYTVLAVSLVNRHLRTITFVKQLWMSLIDDLRARGFFEIPLSDLSQYTTSQLIDQVRTLVVGPQTWRADSDLSSEVQPLLTKEIIVPVTTRVGYTKVHLINGGRHVIMGWFRGLEIWDLKDKRRVWTRATDTIPAADAGQFTVGRTIEDNALTVAVIAGRRKALEIIRIDLQHWNVTETVNVALPQDQGGVLVDDAINGNLVFILMSREAPSG